MGKNTLQLFLTLYVLTSLLETEDIEFESKVIACKKYAAVLHLSLILQH